MKLVVSLVLLLTLVGPSLAEGPAPSLLGMAKPPVTHQEVADKLDLVLMALKDIEIRASQAKVVSDIQNAIAWASEKVKKDLRLP